MHSVSPIREGLFQLLYSVIETGVCRVVTSNSPKSLAALKRIYIENIPKYHQCVFLSGKIQNLEDLTHALEKSGIKQFSTIENNEQFIAQAKQYLIANKGKGVTTIWALENADLVSNDMHQLLAQLLLCQSFGSSLLAIELWGHSLLANAYNSGEISKYYQCKIYPISLNEKLNLKNNSINIKLVITLVIGLFLGHNIAPLLENLSAVLALNDNSTEPQLISSVSHVKVNKLAPELGVAKPVFDNAADKNSSLVILEQSTDLMHSEHAVFAEVEQSTPIALTNRPEETMNNETHNVPVAEPIVEPENTHWYFTLLARQWLSEYNINLTHQLQTKDNQYYIQYGVYQHKSSIIRFIKQKPLLSDYYHLCYSSDWQKVALMTGAYQGYRQAFNQLVKVKEQGGSGTIVDASYLKSWQCSNENS
ncbi:MAG: hypothetical protein V5786_03640 [Psychromonas sp.]